MDSFPIGLLRRYIHIHWCQWFNKENDIRKRYAAFLVINSHQFIINYFSSMTEYEKEVVEPLMVIDDHSLLDERLILLIYQSSSD